MNIVLANENHIPGMLSLLRQVGQVHRDIRPDIFRPGCQKYDAPALKALLSDANCPIFIAETEGAVKGYCFCVIRAYRDSGAMTDRTEIYVDDLCVDESCRGQGIATALYRHVTDYAKEIGCSFVTLNVWCGNDSAMRFYEKMGMQMRSITMETKLC